MKKVDYLNLLRFYLRELPEVIINDIIYDYEEHFINGFEEGKTEEEISEELGSPEEIANEILHSENFGKEKFKRSKNKSGEYKVENEKKSFRESNFTAKVVIVVVGIIFILPIIMLLIGALFAIIMAIFGIGIAFVLTGISLIVGSFATIPHFGIGLIIHPLTAIFAAIFCVSLGILLIRVIVIFVKWLVKSIKDFYYSIKWKRG